MHFGTQQPTNPSVQQSTGHMSSFMFFIVMVALLLMFYAFFMGMLNTIKVLRRISKLKQSKIMSAPPHQYVELQGVAKPTSTGGVISPLTQKHCLCYRYTIEELRSARGKNAQQDWMMIEDVTSSAFFVIDDGTGQCLISPSFAEIVTEEETWTSSTLPDWLQSGTNKTGLLSKLSALEKKQYKFTESRIEENGSIFAVGFFRTYRADEHPFLEDQLKRTIKIMAARDRKSIRDTPATLTKMLDAQWQALVQSRNRLETLNILINLDEQVVVSTFPEKKLANKYRKNTMFAGLAVVVLGGSIVFLFFKQFFS